MCRVQAHLYVARLMRTSRTARDWTAISQSLKLDCVNVCARENIKQQGVNTSDSVTTLYYPCTHMAVTWFTTWLPHDSLLSKGLEEGPHGILECRIPLVLRIDQPLQHLLYLIGPIPPEAFLLGLKLIVIWGVAGKGSFWDLQLVAVATTAPVDDGLHDLPVQHTQDRLFPPPSWLSSP